MEEINARLVALVNSWQKYVDESNKLKKAKVEEERPPRDCKEVQSREYNKSGIYKIQPKLAQKPF